MRSAQRRTFAIALAVSSLSLGARAWALDESTKESVRVLANEAAADFDAARYAAALEKFQRAYDAAKVPKLALWLARTNIRLGRLVAALELYREAGSLERNALWLGSTQQQAQQDAARELAELEPRIPRLLVQVEAADPREVQLSVDGIAVPNSLLGVARILDPGEHRIVAKAGVRSAEEKVTLAEGERREVRLRFNEPAAAPNASVPVVSSEPPPAPAPVPDAKSSPRRWGWVVLSAGVAGLAVGTGAGIVVAVKHGKLSDECKNERCEPEHWSDVDAYRTWRTVSTVGFVVGAVGTVAGVTWLLTHPRRADATVLGVSIAPGSVSLHGAF